MADNKMHDSYDENGYKKRCYCEKCKRIYDEWCRNNKETGQKVCERKCYTICEIKCERPKVIVKHWGYKQEFEGKWEPFVDPLPVPKHCGRCKKENADCKCDKKKRVKKA